MCLGQASVWSTLFLGVFLGPFAAREMTGSFALSGLPFAMYFLANLLVLVPAGRLMDRIGRTPVLALGHIAGAGGAFSVAAGLAFNAWGAAGVVSIALACALAPLAAGAALSRDRFAKASLGTPTADR